MQRRLGLWVAGLVLWGCDPQSDSPVGDASGTDAGSSSGSGGDEASEGSGPASGAGSAGDDEGSGGPGGGDTGGGDGSTSGSSAGSSDAGDGTSSGGGDGGSTSAASDGETGDSGGDDGGASVECDELQACCEELGPDLYAGCMSVVDHQMPGLCQQILDTYHGDGYCTGETYCDELGACCAELPPGPGWEETCSYYAELGNQPQCAMLIGDYQLSGYCF